MKRKLSLTNHSINGHSTLANETGTNIVNSGCSDQAGPGLYDTVRTRTADFKTTTVLAPPTESVFPNIDRRFFGLSHPEFLFSVQYPQFDFSSVRNRREYWDVQQNYSEDC